VVCRALLGATASVDRGVEPQWGEPLILDGSDTDDVSASAEASRVALTAVGCGFGRADSRIVPLCKTAKVWTDVAECGGRVITRDFCS
jgi:hypothetical protein